MVCSDEDTILLARYPVYQIIISTQLNQEVMGMTIGMLRSYASCIGRYTALRLMYFIVFFSTIGRLIKIFTGYFEIGRVR